MRYWWGRRLQCCRCWLGRGWGGNGGCSGRVMVAVVVVMVASVEGGATAAAVPELVY